MPKRTRLLAAITAAAIALSAPAARAGSANGNSAPSDNMVAAIDGAAGLQGRPTGVPTVISGVDASLYGLAFGFTERRQWAAADRVMALVHDRLLIGHLLAARYLATGGRVQGSELKDWMAQYADLPEADGIYALARQRLDGRVREIKPPARPDQSGVAAADDNSAAWEDFTVDADPSASAAKRNRIAHLKSRIRFELRHDRTDAATSAIARDETDHMFAPADADEMKVALATTFFRTGDDADAVRWASQAAQRSGDVIPEAHWLAGLALWREGRRVESARHFEAVANAVQVSTWLRAAGAYWAARANLAARRPEVVNHWLQEAAFYPRTLYGILARRALGIDIQYAWDSRPFTEADAEIISHVPGGRRALALLQVGQRGLAEEEFDALVRTAGPALSRSMLALSHIASLPNLAVALSDRVNSQQSRIEDAADYPLPAWRPLSGWKVDKALVLAIARQESSFNPRAHSPAGAIGLMQLMPRTARSMGARGRLTDPRVSLEVGQRYIHRLLENDAIKGNLLFLAASYNGGLGSVARWNESIHHHGDALLFLESIPVQETRVFVERVLTNFWAYRNRFGQPSPSLDAIAAGNWPMYDGRDGNGKAPRYVEN